MKYIQSNLGSPPSQDIIFRCNLQLRGLPLKGTVLRDFQQFCFLQKIEPGLHKNRQNRFSKIFREDESIKREFV